VPRVDDTGWGKARWRYRVHVLSLDKLLSFEEDGAVDRVLVSQLVQSQKRLHSIHRIRPFGLIHTRTLRKPAASAEGGVIRRGWIGEGKVVAAKVILLYEVFVDIGVKSDKLRKCLHDPDRRIFDISAVISDG